MKMPFELITVACLSDNYAFIAHETLSGATVLVDIPESQPILKILGDKGWILSDIIITHHHNDHIQGLTEVLAVHPARVIGAASDSHRLPPLDLTVCEGDTVDIGNQTGKIFDVSGHTLGHVAIYFETAKLLFTGDSLMALGCGRLFEGNAERMLNSLRKLAVLDPESLVCSGHEYTSSNARFALSIDPKNKELIKRAKIVGELRAKGLPTVPSSLREELETNPFLRPQSKEIRINLDLQSATDTEVFAEIRSRKDNF